MSTVTEPAPHVKTAIPDLRDVALDQLAELPGGLAAAIALYRERLLNGGATLSSFNARI